MMDEEKHATVEHGLWKGLREQPSPAAFAISYRLERDGSFSMADAGTGLAMFAAPRSGLSKSAQHDQAETAREMADYMTSPTHLAAREAAPDYWQAQDADCRARLEAGRTDGSTKEITAAPGQAAKKEPQNEVDAVAASLAARLSGPGQETGAKADPAGDLRFLGFTADGQAHATFQDLRYSGPGPLRLHEASGLPDLTSPDVFSVTIATAARHYGEDFEQKGADMSGPRLHPWLVDRQTAEAMRSRAYDERITGEARERQEAGLAMDRGDPDAWKALPPAPSEKDQARLDELFPPSSKSQTGEPEALYYEAADHAFIVCIPGAGPAFAYAHPGSDYAQKARDEPGLVAYAMAGDLRYTGKSFFILNDNSTMPMTDQDRAEAWQTFGPAIWRGLAKEVALGDSQQQDHQARPGVPGGWGVEDAQDGDEEPLIPSGMDSAEDGLAAAGSKPGLPIIGAPAESAEAEPARRRSTDTERTDPTSHVEKDMARGIGQQIDREQSAIYHDTSLTSAERMAEGETRLRERIEAWDRPGMRAARAVDAGNVRAPAPLLDKLRAAQTPEVQEAVRDKLAKGLWAGDTHQADHGSSD